MAQGSLAVRDPVADLQLDHVPISIVKILIIYLEERIQINTSHKLKEGRRGVRKIKDIL